MPQGSLDRSRGSPAAASFRIRRSASPTQMISLAFSIWSPWMAISLGGTRQNMTHDGLWWIGARCPGAGGVWGKSNEDDDDGWRDWCGKYLRKHAISALQAKPEQSTYERTTTVAGKSEENWAIPWMMINGDAFSFPTLKSLESDGKVKLVWAASQRLGWWDVWKLSQLGRSKCVACLFVEGYQGWGKVFKKLEHQRKINMLRLTKERRHYHGNRSVGDACVCPECWVYTRAVKPVKLWELESVDFSRLISLSWWMDLRW